MAQNQVTLYKLLFKGLENKSSIGKDWLYMCHCAMYIVIWDISVFVGESSPVRSIIVFRHYPIKGGS